MMTHRILLTALLAVMPQAFAENIYGY